MMKTNKNIQHHSGWLLKNKKNRLVTSPSLSSTQLWQIIFICLYQKIFEKLVIIDI